MVKQIGKGLLTILMLMTRSDLIKTLLDDIVNRISPSAEWRQDYETAKSMGLNDVVEYCASINKKTYTKVIEYLRQFVDNGGEMESELSYPQCYTLSVKNNQAQKRKFKNLRTDSDPYVCTLDVFGDNRYISITDDNWVVWERIWCSIGNSVAEKNKFWKELRSTERSLIYIQTAEPDMTPAKKWNIYSYAYLKYINENKFPIPDVLQASELNPIYQPLIYAGRAKYEQFFDVYDVLNEVKYAPDMLMQFVKIYQVLELLAYRYKFQELIDSHVRNHYPIVRQIESMTDKFKKGEQEQLEIFFKEILIDIEKKLDPEMAGGGYPAVPDYLNASIVNYFKQNYKINTAGGRPVFSNKNVADIVYKIRCGIVHNKETEFHLTYNNIEEYCVIVPLIKKINELLLAEIIKMIVDGSKLVYVDKNLTLY